MNRHWSCLWTFLLILGTVPYGGCGIPVGTGHAYQLGVMSAATLQNSTPTTPAVTITGLTTVPANGPLSGGTTITLTGTGFQTGNLAGSTTVTVGGQAATAFTVVSDTRLTVVTPAGTTPGAVDVVVTSSSLGTPVTLTGGFSYNALPAITTVTPDNGPLGGSTTVTIDGTGFQTNVTGSTTVTIGGQNATSISVVSDTRLTAVSPAGAAAGALDVAVANANGSHTRVGGFTYHPLPTLTTVNPARGPLAGATGITLTGTGFQANGAANATVTIDGSPATLVVVVSDTEITAMTPASTLTGAVDVIVTNSNGSATRAGGFFYTGFGPAANFTVLPGVFPGALSRSVAVGDFDGGGLDLVVANFGTNDVSFLAGDGSGGFGFPASVAAGTGPAAVGVGLFDGDANLDLAVANEASNDVTILLGNGAGGFAEPFSSPHAVGTTPVSVAVTNLNGGGLDLVVANSGSNNVSVLLGDGAGGFGAPTNFPVGTTPTSVALGLFDGDANLDLAVANSGSDNVSVLLGNGTGGFGAATNFGLSGGTAPVSIAVGLLNADAFPDLAVANSGSNNVSVLLNDGSGGFGGAANFSIGAGAANPSTIIIGDFDGDGNFDLAVANAGSNDVSVLPGDGAGSFGVATVYALGGPSAGPSSITAADFNGDTNLDLVVANRFSDDVSVLLGVFPP